MEINKAVTAEDVALESMEKDLKAKLSKTEKWRYIRDTDGNLPARVTRAQVIDAFWHAKDQLSHMDTHSTHLAIMLEKLFPGPVGL